MQKLFISPSPHIHSGDSIERNMYGVVLALLPACLISLYFFGLGALVVLLTSILACVSFEWLIAKYLLQTQASITDGSAILTGLLLGMNLPSNLPLWLIIIGALVAIGVGKMSFGGLGGNIFNPALVGRVFLLIAYPAQMTLWPETGQWFSYTDAITGATPLSILKGLSSGVEGYTADMLPSTLTMLLGGHGGSLGEVSALALLLGGLYLIYQRIITWHIPVAVLASSGLLSGLMYIINPAVYASPVVHLLSGGMMLGAFFMATDYVTSPMSKRGQLLFGAMIGVLTILIRFFGAYPEGMSFAILIMNAFTPLINTYIKPEHFGDR